MNELTQLLNEATHAAQPATTLLPEARQHVWDRHFAGTAERGRLAEKLAAASSEFKAAVAVAEVALAEELDDDNLRRARVRAENPTYFKD